MNKNSLLHSTIPTKLHNFMMVDNTKLRLRNIDFNLLQKAIIYCCNQWKHGDWSNNGASNYLSIFRVNSKLQESIIMKGLNEYIINYNETKEVSTSVLTMSQSLKEDKESYPERFGQPTYPPCISYF